MPDDVIAAYCASRYGYDSISASRRRQQPRVLRAFEATLGVPFERATRQDVRAYLESRVAAGTHVNTVRKELGMIRPVYTWLYDNDAIDGEALLQIRSVRPPRGATGRATPNPYERAQVSEMWAEVAAAYPWSGYGARNLVTAERQLVRWRNNTSSYRRVAPYFKRLQIEAIIVLALHGGLRLNEIWRLPPEAMHPENDYLLVVGSRKNRRGVHETRVVPWTTQEFHDTIARWYYARAELVARFGPPARPELTWLSLHGKLRMRPIKQDRFDGLLCHVGSGWQYHRLRHTAATEMIRAGYHLEAARKILGHSSIEQTQGYVKLVDDDLVDASARAAARMGHSLRRDR